jgi:hypothetical protein
MALRNKKSPLGRCVPPFPLSARLGGLPLAALFLQPSAHRRRRPSAPPPRPGQGGRVALLITVARKQRARLPELGARASLRRLPRTEAPRVLEPGHPSLPALTFHRLRERQREAERRGPVAWTSRERASRASPDDRNPDKGGAPRPARLTAPRPKQSHAASSAGRSHCAESDRPRGANTLPQQVARGRRLAVAILEQIAQRLPSLRPLDPVGEPVNCSVAPARDMSAFDDSNPKSQPLAGSASHGLLACFPDEDRSRVIRSITLIAMFQA